MAIVVPNNGAPGLGSTVRTGLRFACRLNPFAVAFCDGDGEYDPAELPNLIEPIEAGRADYVIGSRFLKFHHDMRLQRRLGNWAFTNHLSRLAQTPISDGQSGFRALSGRAAELGRVIHDYNYAQVLTLDLIAKGFVYAEVPIHYQHRQSGRSFVRPIEYATRVLPAMRLQLSAHPIDTSEADDILDSDFG